MPCNLKKPVPAHLLDEEVHTYSMALVPASSLPRKLLGALVNLKHPV
jgi:hypothetical protein